MMIKTVNYLLYNFAIFFYGIAIWIASFFNAKAKIFIDGRKNIFESISTKINGDTSKKIWFHCSSLGEFEQARPIIEAIKQTHIDYKIIITFFSPSGFEIRKNYPLADYIFYLPLDTSVHAKKLLELFNPSMVFFVKYEFWYHYLHQLYNRKTPIYLLSATFLEDQIFFRWYGVFFRNMLHYFEIIFTQNESSKALLKSIQIDNVIVSKDTRFDRVYDTTRNLKPLSKIELFKQDSFILVAGSSYIEEENIINQFLNKYPDKKIKIIIAPHEIDGSHLKEIQEIFEGKKTCFYSTADDENLISSQVLIIDNIGLLSSIYQYADIAIIGGGFGSKGLHNTLEAAAFGMPILFGPNNHLKFPESIQLIENGSAFIIHNSEEFDLQISSFIDDEVKLKNISALSRKFILTNTGATEIILSQITF